MEIDVKGLVDLKTGLVSRRIFADPEIYRMELERIFTRCWLLLGHESQIARPGDFLTTYMGDESVIVCRDTKGQIRAFVNTCRHRGNRVCRADQGRAHSFMCTYHGWTYGLDGSLVGVPGYEERYYGDLDRDQWGLIPVARVATYKGLIFGNFDAHAPPLEDYLGASRWALDYILDQHPGGTEVVGGVFKWLINSNWKLGADNIMGDNYHGGVTHRSATMVGHRTASRSERRNGMRQYTGTDRPGFTAPLDWGHGFMADLQPPGQEAAGDPDQLEVLRNYYQETLPELRSRLGELRARIRKINLTVFPTASFTTSSNMIHVWQPRGPTQTEVWVYTLVDRDAPPEVKRLIRQAAQRHFSPSGLFEQDDMDNWEQSTQAAAGTIARHYPLNYSMGIGHEEWVEARDGLPRRIESIKDESNQRAFYGGWAEIMAAESWEDLLRARREREASLAHVR